MVYVELSIKCEELVLKVREFEENCVVKDMELKIL